MAITRHVFETYVRSTPERVWQALTDPDLTARYFFDCAVESGWEPGGAYRYRGPQGVAVEGTIEEIDPPRRLVLTWRTLSNAEAAAEPPSRVTWEVTPVGDVVRLTCIHGDLAFSPVTWALTGDGWNVVLNGLKTLLETGEPLGDVPDDGRSPFATRPAGDAPVDTASVEGSWHRREGIAANNAVWPLLGRDDRTPDEDAELVHLAHAAVHHWRQASGSTAVNLARGEYLCSRVYAFLGRGEPARYHAERALAITTANGFTDFDLAYAHEAMARALAASGDAAGAGEHLALARSVPVADDEDRSIVEADIAAGPWYGVEVPGADG